MTSEERKTWERTQRRNRIIDIAQEIFFQFGYENTTILQIAKAVGYNKRTIYLYFKDKEEIFLAIVLRGLGILHDWLEHALSVSDRNQNDLRTMGEVFYRFSLEQAEYLKLIMIYESNNCVYYKDLQTKDELNPIQNACQSKTDAIADLMTGSLQKAINNGTIKTSLTPVQLMLVLWGQVFGVMQIILMRQEHFKDAFGISYHDLFQSFMDIVEAGISQVSNG